MRPNNKMVIDKLVIFGDTARRNGDEWVESKIADCKQKSIDRASKLGIKKLNVKESIRPYYTCNFTDYPMYLLGPNAPEIKTWKDALLYSNAAEYQIIVECQDYLDELEEKWLNKYAGKLNEAIKKFGEEAGREIIQKHSNWAEEVMEKFEKRRKELYGARN